MDFFGPASYSLLLEVPAKSRQTRIPNPARCRCRRLQGIMHGTVNLQGVRYISHKGTALTPGATSSRHFVPSRLLPSQSQAGATLRRVGRQVAPCREAMVAQHHGCAFQTQPPVLPPGAEGCRKVPLAHVHHSHAQCATVLHDALPSCKCARRRRHTEARCGRLQQPPLASRVACIPPPVAECCLHTPHPALGCQACNLHHPRWGL